MQVRVLLVGPGPCTAAGSAGSSVRGRCGFSLQTMPAGPGCSRELRVGSSPGDAELTPRQEQPAAEDAAFISIQAFPALLDLPQDVEVSKVSCGSRHTAVVTRECPALAGGAAGSTPAFGQGWLTGAGAHRQPPVLQCGRWLMGAVPFAGGGELYTWGWGK